MHLESNRYVICYSGGSSRVNAQYISVTTNTISTISIPVDITGINNTGVVYSVTKNIGSSIITGVSYQTTNVVVLFSIRDNGSGTAVLAGSTTAGVTDDINTHYIAAFDESRHILYPTTGVSTYPTAYFVPSSMANTVAGTNYNESGGVAGPHNGFIQLKGNVIIEHLVDTNDFRERILLASTKTRYQ